VPEAVGLFGLWLLQCLVPGLREEITWVYGVWAAVETVRLLLNLRRRNAFSVFAAVIRSHWVKG
jgi:hypothetical protein